MNRLIPFALLTLALTGCPSPKKPQTKTSTVNNAKTMTSDAVDSAAESGKTVLDRSANTAGNAVDGAAESGKTVGSRTANTAEKASTGGKKAAGKATKKASGALDKVFGR